MCDPVSITLGILSAASAVEASNAQNEMADATEVAAIAERENTKTALNDRRLQEFEAKTQKSLENSRQSQAAKSEARSMQSSLGIGGLSTNAVLGDISRQEQENASIINKNFNATLSQLSREEDSANALANSRIASAPKASNFGTLLQIGKGGVDAYGFHKTIK